VLGARHHAPSQPPSAGHSLAIAGSLYLALLSGFILIAIHIHY
jgi:hypothetical protein